MIKWIIDKEKAQRGEPCVKQIDLDDFEQRQAVRMPTPRNGFPIIPSSIELSGISVLAKKEKQ